MSDFVLSSAAVGPSRQTHLFLLRADRPCSFPIHSMDFQINFIDFQLYSIGSQPTLQRIYVLNIPYYSTKLNTIAVSEWRTTTYSINGSSNLECKKSRSALISCFVAPRRSSSQFTYTCFFPHSFVSQPSALQCHKSSWKLTRAVHSGRYEEGQFFPL